MISQLNKLNNVGDQSSVKSKPQSSKNTQLETGKGRAVAGSGGTSEDNCERRNQCVGRDSAVAVGLPLAASRHTTTARNEALNRTENTSTTGHGNVTSVQSSGHKLKPEATRPVPNNTSLAGKDSIWSGKSENRTAAPTVTLPRPSLSSKKEDRKGLAVSFSTPYQVLVLHVC